MKTSIQNALIVCLALVITPDKKLIWARPAWEGESTASPPVTGQFSDSNSDGDNHNQRHQQFVAPKTAPINPSYQFDMQVNPFMQLRKLTPTSNNITCNDGSPVGYYMRLNKHSKSWIIYLQGGGFCGNEESCQQRWQTSAPLMSSHSWPKIKTVDGILSNEPKENPYLWNANHIYIPYCSSDSWTGLARANGKNGSSFAFMGSKIIERILESLYDDLPRDSSLHEAKFILLAGDSAGATGVIMNLDRVNAVVQQRASSMRADCNSHQSGQGGCQQRQPPVLRGLADSGWFLDNEPYDFGVGEPYPTSELESDNIEDCSRQRCTPLQSIKQAKLLWNGQVPVACANQYPLEPWRCYFGYRAYQTLSTPLFVVQWLYDEAQLMVDNIARPDTNGQWNYVNKVVNEMRASLENVTALFAPSCFSHSLIIRRSWNQININGFKLPHVLNSWEEQSLLVTASAIEPTQMNNNNDPSKSQHITGYNFPMGLQEVALPLINSSVSSIVNQPTFETVLVEKEPQQQSGSSLSQQFVAPPKDFERDQTQIPYDPRQSVSSSQQQQHKNQLTSSANSNRSRIRKRKRNNHHQQRTKQTRQKSTTSTESAPTTPESPPTLSIVTKESNDLAASANPLQDLLPLIDRSLASADFLYGRLNRDTSGLAHSSSGRLGRSTIVDDATLMLSNNVPDDNSSNNPVVQNSNLKWTWPTTGNGLISSSKHPRTNRFRLIDSCGWPQCNRDCPRLNSDLNLGQLIQF